MLLQRLANTAVAKLLQNFKNYNFDAATKACKYGCCETITDFQEPQHLVLLQKLANTAVTKTTTEFQEPQHLMLLQKLANTVVTKLLQNFKNHNI